MTQADATRIAALCDQEIVHILEARVYNTQHSRILLNLAELREHYVGRRVGGAEVARAPDLSEVTPQTASLYGDGTPGNISQEIERECKPGEIVEVHPKPGESFVDAINRTQREIRGEEKFDFRLNDIVCLNYIDLQHATRGIVRGFRDGKVLVQWRSQDDCTEVRNDYLVKLP